MLDNILTRKRATLVFIMPVGYEIDFAVLIQLEIYVRAFSETLLSLFLA